MGIKKKIHTASDYSTTEDSMLNKAFTLLQKVFVLTQIRILHMANTLLKNYGNMIQKYNFKITY